ncbi:MAG: DUF4248 domain-containing protein [Bacteroidaceae bacterium]|nr:DUF4248 domain-containing protein [Bacteroidaceae bacterium]
MKVRAYSKKELALAYLPDISPESAVNRLMCWIKLNRELTRELKKTGYSRWQKMLTARQVALIFHYLGEP